MTTNIITNTIVPESDRMAIVDRLFGIAYVLKLEPAVFSIAEALSDPGRFVFCESLDRFD